jgi:Protein of unknown function (DUF1553)/Protein of unknown function (DUF1549)/Planctomycete cytochrome C
MEGVTIMPLSGFNSQIGVDRWCGALDSVTAGSLARSRRGSTTLLLVMTTMLWSGSVVAADDGIDLFESKIRPILVKRCEKCHGEKKQEGGLRLDQKAGWARGGDQGPAIVPGKPHESLLVKAVSYADEALQMPPGGKLPEREVEALLDWVKRGAADPRDAGPVKLGGMTLSDAKNFWSLQPVKRPSVPGRTRRAANAGNAIDSFVLARLDRAGISPLLPTDKRTLIRRATYDLTGLPPTREELEQFLKDDAEDAFSRVVDRLLASPHYGEHWGRHWLDLVRYADTAGENTDHPLPHAWKYRNWVIAAFNRDMPYDAFVQDQIAGDILAPKAPPSAYEDHIVATGFLAIARRFGHDIDKDMYLTHEDVIDTMGKVFLGMSIGCARCHAHKYDPISAEDYYALYGILESTRFSFPGCEPDPKPRDLVPLKPARLWDQIITPFRKRLAVLDAELRKIDEEQAALPKRRAGAFPGSSRILAQGAIDDSGSQVVSTADGKKLIRLEVEVGQMLELLVTPRGNHGADSTLVEWEIDETDGAKRHWSLTRDAMSDLLIRNPEPGSQREAATWYFVDARDGKKLLGESIRDLAGNSGLHAWRNGDTPSVFVNASDRPIRVWTSLSPQSFFVHPAADGPVAVAWSSPISGTVTMTARIADAHPGGSDGVGWRLEWLEKGVADELRALGELATKRQATARERALVVASQPRNEVAYAVTEGTPHDTRLQMRGDPEKPGPVVPRRWLEVLGGYSVAPGAGSGRSQLAGWLTAPANPLAARVMANRIWQYHFGKGLVRTPNDFGSRGLLPTHPELLDWLAAELVESGWRIKPLHRLIMLSDAYRRSSSASSPPQREVDPENQLYWRFERRRLSAEELRDSLLEVSGQLDCTSGGPHPFPPESSWSFTQHNPFSADYETRKRGVYLMVQRNRRDPFLTLFDGADPNATTPERQETTVPPQALYVLNAFFFHEQAGKLADALLAEPDEVNRVELGFRSVLQRSPTVAERERAKEFLVAYIKELRDVPAAEKPRLAWSAWARVLLGSNEFMYLD